MSRYVMVKTQLRDLRLLRETLQGMGCSVQGGAAVRLSGRRAPGGSGGADAGRVGRLRAGGGDVRAVGMEELLRRGAFRRFLEQVTRQYARRQVMAESGACRLPTGGGDGGGRQHHSIGGAPMVASKQQIEFRITNGEVEFVIKGVKGRSVPMSPASLRRWAR